MAKRKQEISETLVNINDVTGSLTSFYDKNKNIILGIGGGILVLILGYYFYVSLYVGPKQQEAIKQMSKAEQLFERDSFAAALNNPGGGFPGFIEIANKYSSTPSGNLANYYAGISLLHTGRPAEALKYLEEYDAKGKTLEIMRNVLIGDAYADQNKLEDALNYYKKAANDDKNEAASPFALLKLGMLYEKMSKPKEAKETYQKIKDNYAGTAIGQNIDKYLYRLSE